MADTEFNGVIKLTADTTEAEKKVAAVGQAKSYGGSAPSTPSTVSQPQTQEASAVSSSLKQIVSRNAGAHAIPINPENVDPALTLKNPKKTITPNDQRIGYLVFTVHESTGKVDGSEKLLNPLIGFIGDRRYLHHQGQVKRRGILSGCKIPPLKNRIHSFHDLALYSGICATKGY